MSFYAFYPSSSSSTNPSVGLNGSTAPTSSTEVGGIGADGNLHALSTDNSGVLNVNTTSSVLPTGAATAANQTTEISRLTDIDTAVTALNVRTAGSLVPLAYNEIDLTYVVSGNGIGQIATAIYKLASSTVATLTMSYDASNNLSSVVKS